MKSTGILTLTKMIPAWNQFAVRAAMAQLKRVNSDAFSTMTSSGNITWCDAPLVRNDGVMMFTDITVEAVQRSINETTENIIRLTNEPAYRVTLTFKYNPDGWQHHLFHVFKETDTGIEVPVMIRNGQGVSDNLDRPLAGGTTPKETFRLYEPTSLGSIVEAFR